MDNGIPISPFEFGRVLGADEIVNRKEELALLRRVIDARQKLFLIGPRRYGKSSLLAAAAEQAESRKTAVPRLDAEAFPSINSLAERLMTDSVRILTPTLDRARQALTEFFARLRPQLVIDPQSGELSATITHAPTHGEVPQVADVLDGIEQMAKRARRTVVVMLDEFQRIVEDEGERAEAQIRAAVQQHRQVAYVFAGSKTRLLHDMTADANRPFYKLGEVHVLGGIARSDWTLFIATHFADARIPVADGAIDAILDAAMEVPYNVQLLAHACWQACHSPFGVLTPKAKPLELTPALVDATARTVALRADPFYTQLWSGLTSHQQRTLLAVLHESGERLTSGAVSARYRVGVPTIARSLKLLESKGIIREDQDQGRKRMRLEDPMFGIWIREVIQGL